MRDVGGRRLRHGRKKKSAEGLYCRRVFRGGEVVQCSVLEELKLAARTTVGSEALSDRKKSYDETQRKRTAEFERRVQISEGSQPIQKLHQRRIEVGKESNLRGAVTVVV